MANDWKYSEDKKHIIIEPPKQKLRITGHRIASVLGLNQYQSPFGAWCEITKLVKLPFEDNKYTIAGKTIEPKLIDVVRKKFPNVMSIKEYYGNNFKKYEYNNFIDDSNIFGGIIDSVATKEDLKTLTMIVECKTSSKPHLWENNNVPIEYLLQGCQYSYFKKLDRVLFICAFLQEEDYNHPEKFIPTEKNTIMVVKKIKDVRVEMPNGNIITFEEAIKYCEDWWEKYIETGISPEFDEEKDKEYLDILRKAQPINDNSVEELCDSALLLAKEIEQLKETSGLNEKTKELKKLEDNIKNVLMGSLKEGETTISCKQYKLSGTTKETFDEKRFEKEHPKAYKEYLTSKTTYTLRKNIKEEGEE